MIISETFKYGGFQVTVSHTLKHKLKPKYHRNIFINKKNQNLIFYKYSVYTSAPQMCLKI